MIPAFFDPEQPGPTHDPWGRRRRVSALITSSQTTPSRDVLEGLLFDSDPIVSQLAFQGLRRLSPPPADVDAGWKSVFAESVHLLLRQAGQGPIALRIPAVQALAFAPATMTIGLIDTLLQNFPKNSGEVSLWPHPPGIPLMNFRPSTELPEGFALLLSGLASPEYRVSLLRRELTTAVSRENLLSALLSLQVLPEPELIDELLPHIRSAEPLVAVEAIRALHAAGGGKVFHLLGSLFHETGHPDKRSRLLELLASTGREEALAMICQELKAGNAEMLPSAINALETFPLPGAEKSELLSPFLNHPVKAIQIEAAVCLWRLGSMEALPRLEALVRDAATDARVVAAAAFGRLPPGISLSPLLEQLALEKNGDVRRQILQSLRQLLPRVHEAGTVIERLLPLLARFLSSSEVFFRNQAAVLCGYTGHHTHDLIVKALDREENPHVMASLIKALGRLGSPKVLIFARFLDQPDPRVRSNLMEAFLFSGVEAIPFLTRGLKDPSPRVRASAALSLFLLGQTEVVGILNRMLLTSSPSAILSACHCFHHIFRHFPILDKPESPIALALRRLHTRHTRPAIREPQPDESPLSRLLVQLSGIPGGTSPLIAFLHEQVGREPSCYFRRRLLAAFLLAERRFEQALPLLERCLEEQPHVLADQFDAYRSAVAVGEIARAGRTKQVIIRTYNTLLAACEELCRAIRGKGAEELLEKLLSLRRPSMNLYNAMIQLKMIQGERDTVLELLQELFLARPLNEAVVRKMAELLPDEKNALKSALIRFAEAFSREKGA